MKIEIRQPESDISFGKRRKDGSEEDARYRFLTGYGKVSKANLSFRMILAPPRTSLNSNEP